MQKLSKEVEMISGYVGLRMNAAKCKIVVSNCREDSTAVTVDGAEIEVVEDFCYLRSHILETVIAQELGKHQVSLVC